MKRAPFLAAAGSAVLAGCGSHSVLNSVLPGATSRVSAPSSGPLRLVPDTADVIPASVLANPFMGEAWRFDGAVAPAGWMFLRGQSLNVSDYRPLFSVIGTMGGGDGKASFKLPNLSFGVIISAAGAIPTGPAFLAASKRAPTALASLGPNAQRRFPQIAKPASRELLAQQQLAASAIRVSSGRVQPLPDDVRARIDQVQGDARGAALAALTPANQSRVAQLLDRVISGGTTLSQASLEMAGALSSSEAQALLGVFDGTQRTLRQGWSGMNHADPQSEAGRYLVSIAFTPDQLRAFNAMASNE